MTEHELKLFPETRHIRGELYVLSYTVESWEMANTVADKLRKKEKQKVVIRKESNGEYGIWVKLIIRITEKGREYLRQLRKILSDETLTARERDAAILELKELFNIND